MPDDPLDSLYLLPSAAELKAFVADSASDKRERLVRRLLEDRRRYAEHWITFWNDLLRNDYAGTDYLAEDLAAHGFDLKQTIHRILTSQAYQLPSVLSEPGQTEFVFRGPAVRRLSAEQFVDAARSITGAWPALPSPKAELPFLEEGWTAEAFEDAIWGRAANLGPVNASPWALQKEIESRLAAVRFQGETRAALQTVDPLTAALGRPNREQVVTVLASDATTLQALELTNGGTLSRSSQRKPSTFTTRESSASAACWHAG